MSARLHEYEQVDQGERYCLHCSQPNTMFCSGMQITIAKPSNNDTVRRELDAIARQLLGIAERLKRLRAT